MKVGFNSNGNLHKTIDLTFDELYEYFGTNPFRKKKIDTAILFLKLFSSCGCTTAYIGGKFCQYQGKTGRYRLMFRSKKSRL